MDPRIKRIAFLLPPVIIAGVWFDLIPIAPGLRSKIDSFKVAPPAVKKNLPLLVAHTGAVSFRERPALPESPVKGGEVLSEGSSLTVPEESSALITFTDTDTWKLRVAGGTRINVDKLSPASTIINLVKGSIVLSAKNNSGRIRPVSVRTSFASFTFSSATVAVISDADKWNLMSVKEGTVVAENFKLMEKTQVHEGFSYLINRDGIAKNQLELSAIDLFHWDLSRPDPTVPAIDQVLVKFEESVAAVPDEKEKIRQDNLSSIDEALKNFRKEHADLQRELEILAGNARDSREGFVSERRKVDKDIRCLQTSVSECNLFSEKILLLQGFPRTWGNPAYRESLVTGLRKYLQGREEEVGAREEEARILGELMKKREAALSTAETLRSREENPDRVVPLLQDARLRR